MHDALLQVLQPEVLLVIAAAAVYGIFVGSIPGLTATMAVALLVPVTFFLDDVSALAAIVTTVTCSIFAGDIPGALVRIPGTPASAAYTLDAYAMTREGRQEQALGISLIFSVVGGLFGVVILLLIAPQLGRLIVGGPLEMTNYEYFWLCFLGLSCAAIVSRESRLKGVFALSIGLLISTIGISPVHAVGRFVVHEKLFQGIHFLPAMIGLFGLSEVLRNVLHLRQIGPHDKRPAAGEGGPWRQHVVDPLKALLGHVVPFLWVRKLGVLRSSTIGSFIGMLPGAGADLAAWISYAVSKRFSKRPEEYGNGSTEGLGDATSANNSALASAWVPALVFGIPGDSVTAIALGVLLMKNVVPGPDIFTKQATLVSSIFLVFIVANLLLIPIGLAAIRFGTLLVRVPRRVLMPVILVFCILGAYSFRSEPFDVCVMLAMGLLGFFLESMGVPLAPVVLGIILGGELEHRFIQSLTSSEHWWDFVDRPTRGLLAFACLALWFGPMSARLVRWRRRRMRRFETRPA